MSDQSSIVTTCTFKGKDYLVKMNIVNGNTLELFVTDKYSAEDWQCCYNASYIESLTQKTGNYKQFEVFVTMLKSGLLKTSECVSLDLLTHEDLEILRTRRGVYRSMYGSSNVQGSHVMSNSNRRFFIITYNVEFDRIHYPLPMEYCGPPDPQVLQATVRRLEAEVSRLQSQLVERSSIGSNERTAPLERRIEELTVENRSLKEEVRHLNKILTNKIGPVKQLENTQRLIHSLENKIQRKTICQNLTINRLMEDKTRLQIQVKELRASEKSLQLELQKLRKELLNVDHDNEGKEAIHVSRNKEDVLRNPKVPFDLRDAKHSMKAHRVQTIKSIPRTTTALSQPIISCFLPAGIGKSHHVRSRSSSESSVGSSASRHGENKVSRHRSETLRSERRSRTRKRGSRTRKNGSSGSSVSLSPSGKLGSRNRDNPARSRNQSPSKDMNRNKHKSRSQKQTRKKDCNIIISDIEKRLFEVEKMVNAEPFET